MSEVSQELFERWKGANQVGAAEPTMRVTVTRGLIDKHYAPFEFIGGGTEDFCEIVGGNNREPWQGFWRATGEPKELPNILAVKWLRNLQQKGSCSATIEVENIIYKAIVGVGGTYHAILRGYLSPWLGMKIIGRAQLPSWEENEWYEVLDNGYRIDVYEGYGDQQTRTFSGLIEEADLEDQPDRIIITARDFGILLTDQRIVGSNKPPEVRAPLFVWDRERALGVQAVGGSPVASSTAAGRRVGSVVEPHNTTDWVSTGHETGAHTEYVEIDIPPGYYENLYTVTPYDGQALYISIYAGAGSEWNGAAEEGWLGAGEVPNGSGIPFTNRWGSSTATGATRSLGGELQAAAGTKLRISLANLPYRSEWGDHRAGLTRLAAFLLGGDKAHPAAGDPNKKYKGYLLVDDASDVAKAVFMWMGFHEWEVEKIGASFEKPVTFGLGEFFIQMLEFLEKQANFLYYMQSPSSSSESIGVPCFVENTACSPAPRDMIEVTDKDLLESIKAKLDLSNLPFSIRYRGNVTPTGSVIEEGEGGGIKRFSALYFPPWAGAGPDETEPGRNAGVRRQELTIDQSLLSDEECMAAAILAAQQYALEAYTAEIQISGYPGLELNEQISVVDKTTGINSRMWVSSIQSEHMAGAEGKWKMTVEGALLDNEDMQQLAKDLTFWTDLVQDLRGAKDSLVGELIY